MAPARKPAPSRKPATKPSTAKSKPRARARRLAPGAVRLPLLEQRHLDIVGLGLVAIGVFLAFPVYLGWEGGAAGGAATRGLAYVVGQVAYAVPMSIVAAGAILVLRPVLPAVRPFRSGALCLFMALTLALAAGTFGLGPPGARSGYWNVPFFEARGGIVGDALLYATATAVSTIGAHILAVFLFVAAVLLLTGASVAGVLRATGSGLADTTRAIGRAVPARRGPAAPAPDDVGFVDAPQPQPPQTAPAPPEPPMHPPEPPDSEVVVRATHVEAPSLDGATRYPDLYGEPVPDPEPEAAASADALDLGDEPPELPDPTEILGREPPVPTAADLTPQGRLRGSVTDDPGFEWRLPPPELLRRSTAEQSRPDTAGQEKTAARLIEALGHFGVQSKVVGTVAGPHITRFELRLAPGIKMSKVAQLKDDLAYALAATDIRILAPIPGKTAVGVEVPNLLRRIVQLGDVFQDAPAGWSPLTVWLGKDVAGKAIGADLTKMPHLLVAGTTGAGKSGAINAMLSSVLLRATPHELRLVLIDPKQVELNHYESIPHLLTPVITSPRMAANALQNLVREMEQRYSIMSLAKTRSLIELNRARAKRGDPPLPYILCVIDELADLMMVAPADVEDSIIRLAQKARAVGIHLVLATQSPRVDVITGMIKANVPSRIAFSVSSQTDSRVILDQNGAESLLGQGDMLFSPVGSSRLQRIQGAYIDEPQIEALTTFWRRQGEPELREDLLDEVQSDADADAGEADDGFSPDEDALLEDAIRLVVEMGTASTSMLQRRLRLGYTRAGRLIDMLERRSVISGYEGSKPRQVLVAPADVERFIANLRERGEAIAPAPAAEFEPESSEPAPVRE
ncbi:MAG: segregation ATPase FtsK/SpoIIIE, family [Solirubrobacteraceae bacterium]|jgi:S-DNA-T family DNA segregation ATPase FtsK/SpoIIIE|nr:segregation ATPase FtsK/SpoIIIE, family [Solirubrobacteraceae bacterium]